MLPLMHISVDTGNINPQAGVAEASEDTVTMILEALMTPKLGSNDEKLAQADKNRMLVYIYIYIYMFIIWTV